VPYIKSARHCSVGNAAIGDVLGAANNAGDVGVVCNGHPSGHRGSASTPNFASTYSTSSDGAVRDDNGGVGDRTTRIIGPIPHRNTAAERNTERAGIFCRKHPRHVGACNHEPDNIHHAPGTPTCEPNCNAAPDNSRPDNSPPRDVHVNGAVANRDAADANARGCPRTGTHDDGGGHHGPTSAVFVVDDTPRHGQPRHQHVHRLVTAINMYSTRLGVAPATHLPRPGHAEAERVPAVPHHIHCPPVRPAHRCRAVEVHGTRRRECHVAPYLEPARVGTGGDYVRSCDRCCGHIGLQVPQHLRR